MGKGKKPAAGHEACSGCGVCLLSCPVFDRERDQVLSAKGRALALQGGAPAEGLIPGADACLLCGACIPVCPEQSDPVGICLALRRKLNETRAAFPGWYPDPAAVRAAPAAPPHAGSVLLAGDPDGYESGALEAVLALLSAAGPAAGAAPDDGGDLARLIEAGLPLPPDRVSAFLSPLFAARLIVAAEGILHTFLRERLPGKKVLGLGPALLAIPAVRAALGPGDFLVIESRGFHADYPRLIRFYDTLSRERGCRTNLDLHRMAASTGASSLRGRADPAAAGCVERARRILRGPPVGRVVVECAADLPIFREAADVPVVHVSALAGWTPPA